MSTQAPTRGAIAAALIFALSVFGFTLYVWRSFGGTTPLKPQGYRVHVLFGPGGTQLVTNADVRIAGVRVGKVRGLEPAGLRTDAEIELESRYAPLSSDARAILRPKTLLGETFVQLTPGSKGAPKLPDRGTLGVGQVDEPQGVDRVLATFDRPTRAAFRDVLQSFALALDGRSGDLSASFGSLAPATEELRRLVGTLRRRDGELRGLLRDGGVTLRAVGAREDALRRLVVAGDAALAVTAASGRDLTSTIRELPGVLREARATLAEAGAAAQDAAPTLRVLRPVAPLLRPALVETERLAPQLGRLGRRLPAVIDAARSGLPALTRTLQVTPALLTALRDAGRDLVPVLGTLETYRTDLVQGVAKAGAALNATSDGQHLLRALFVLFNESLVGYEQKLGSSRSNPYVKPGGLQSLIAGGQDSLDCSTATNPQTVPVIGQGAPPCKEQGPWTLLGRTALLPAPQQEAP